MIFVDGKKVSLNHFNDQTYYILLNNEGAQDVTITWLFEDNEEAMALYFITKHLHEKHSNIVLNMPFCPNSRQDRVMSSYDIFTLKYFANFINSLNFSEVRIYDPHSDVTAALIDRCVVTTPKVEVDNLLAAHPGILVVYPDSGSTKKYGPMFKVPYLRGIKVRNFETHRIESFQLVGTGDSIVGRDILIVDDICGTGHTLYKAARELKNMGAKDIYIFVSHCEKSVLGPHIQGESLLDIPNLITKLYTTNSIFHETHSKIEIVRTF